MSSEPKPGDRKPKSLEGKELAAYISSLIDRYFGKTAIKNGLDYLENYRRMSEFANGLKAKYPEEWRGSRAFHALVSSTMDDEDITREDDFEGEDSIVAFLEQELGIST